MIRGPARLGVALAASMTACIVSTLLINHLMQQGGRHGRATDGFAEHLLHDSWASDGHRGFFVETAGPAGSAVSLADTAWWSRLISANPQVAQQLDPSVVRRWLVPFLSGSGDDTGIADTDAMPPIARISFAVQLATTLHITVNRDAVTSRMERLRAGELYGSGLEGKPASLGNTAVALAILHAVGAAPPAEVSNGIARRVPDAIASRQPEKLLSDTVPVLTSLTADTIRASAQQVRDQLAWISEQLPWMPPIQRVTVAHELRGVLSQTGVSPWPASMVCQGLLVGEDGVRAGEGTAVDAQLTVRAMELGCPIVNVSPPPTTSAGWPNTRALGTSLQASVAGLRIARKLGRQQDYLPLLREQSTSIWKTGSKWTASPAGKLARNMLARIAAIPSDSDPSLGSQLPATIHADPSPNDLPVLLAAWLNGMKADADGYHLATSETVNVFAAAGEELKYRMTGDVRYAERARGLLSRLKAGGHLYAVDTLRGSHQASVVATAVAAWILGQQIPMSELINVGLCQSEDECGQLDGSTSQADSALRATAAVIAVAHPDGASFPLAL